MARSQTQFARGETPPPGLRDTADIDEAARWEAYCALQARKRSRLQPFLEGDAGYNPSSNSPAKSWAFANEDRAPDHDRAAPANIAWAGGPASRSPAARRKAPPAIVLAIVAGGIVIAGALLTHPQMTVRAPAERDVHHAFAVTQAAPPGAPVPQPPAPENSSPAPTRQDIATSRPTPHRAGQHAVPAGLDRGRQHRPDLVSRRPAESQLGRGRKVGATPTALESDAVRQRAAASLPNSQPGPRPKLELQQKEPATTERPAVSQRLIEYRASQAEYERELRSYEQAMARYYSETGAERPLPPRHSADPVSAMDSLSWRR